MFSLTEIYSCTRERYLQETGIDAQQLIDMLEAEVKMLKKSYKRVQAHFRTNKAYSTEMLYEIKLMQAIDEKMKRKSEKIKELKEMV